MASTRITIATITTKDQRIVEKTNLVRAMGIKHTEIYEKGLDEIITQKGLAKTELR